MAYFNSDTDIYVLLKGTALYQTKDTSLSGFYKKDGQICGKKTGGVFVDKKFSEFCMGNLKPYHALVMTSGHTQKLFSFNIQNDLQLFKSPDIDVSVEDKTSPLQSPASQSPIVEPLEKIENEEHESLEPESTLP